MLRWQTEECTADSWDEMCARPLVAAFQQAQGPSDLHLIRPLLSAGADIHIRDGEGATVMHDMIHRWAAEFVATQATCVCL